MIQSVSDNQNFYRKLAGIHVIESIPTTSIGKVKRYKLKDTIPIAINVKQTKADETDHRLVKLLRKYVPESIIITGNSSLKYDLNMESLNLFEMCVEIQTIFGVDVSSKLNNDITVTELWNMIESNSISETIPDYDINLYPLPKSQADMNILRIFMEMSYRLWDIRICGTENIKPNERYILCPNHESHLDTLWITAALLYNGVDIRRRSSCMGAEYVMFDKILGKGFKALGGIPVDRSGNPARALKRAYEFINNTSDCVFMIHPEGTRTRDGKLGEFKSGAAELALTTGSKLIPVCINGAREIFPPDNHLPSIARKNGKKQILTIYIGEAIDTIDKTVDELTTEIRKFIIRHKYNY